MRALGLPADDPTVVAEGYSVRVRLGDVLTRVVTVGTLLRGDPLPWLHREVDVARHLSAAGAAVVAPHDDAGPHRAAGLDVTVWPWVEPVGGVVTQQQLGALLGDLHAALATYDADLPPLVGPLTDVRTALAVSDHAVLHAAAAELVPLALAWPRRPVHGDVHTGNLLLGADGPRWIDLEDVCSGPVEWDLASRTLTADAVAAYPGPVDVARLADCRRVRQLQVLAGVLTDDLSPPELLDDVLAALS